MKFAMNGRVKFALAMIMTLLLACCLAFAQEAQAADSAISAGVTKYERYKGSDGFWWVRVFLEVTNRADDDRVIISVYDLSFEITAELTDLFGKTYRFKHKPFWRNVNPRHIELGPADSQIFALGIRYDFFKCPNWKWEGEEKTGKPPLTNFRTSKITMKHQSRKPERRRR